MNVDTLKGIGRIHHLDAVDFPALADIDLDNRPNYFTFIAWPSGSGKITLLNLISCIYHSDHGCHANLAKVLRDLRSDLRPQSR